MPSNRKSDTPIVDLGKTLFRDVKKELGTQSRNYAQNKAVEYTDKALDKAFKKAEKSHRRRTR